MNGTKRTILSSLMCLVLLMSLLLPVELNSSVFTKPAYADGEIKTTGANGEYVIYLLEDGTWVKTGQLEFDQFLREKSINLSKFLSDRDSVNLKIIKSGGGSAHIDSVYLGEAAPIKVNNKEENFLRKLSSKDLDLINVDEEGIELVFPAERKNDIIALTGRIEGKFISKEPFKFPSANNFKEINQYSRFYSYNLDSQQNSLVIDGVIDEVSLMKPLFKEFCTPGTGHPAGYTYGWVMNDNEYLYVAMDFTPDNTMDGDKDYAKVYVKTASGVNEFKVSVPETQWGQPGFVYTDKVGYQHKVYEFKIPLTEIDVNDNKVYLAFSAYGTAAIEQFSPSPAFDSNNDRYLLAYVGYEDYEQLQVYGQFIDSDGEIYGSSFNISNHYPVETWYWITQCKIVFDSSRDRYLITWSVYSRPSENYTTQIFGQYLDSSGNPIGEKFEITDEMEDSSSTYDFAYNNNTGNSLMVWNSNGQLFGTIIFSDGSCGPVIENIYNSISVDLENILFFQDFSVACDGGNRYLVVCDAYKRVDTGVVTDIYGQFIDDSGQLIDESFIITDSYENQYIPYVTYNEYEQEFLTIWLDGRDGNTDGYYFPSIYGRLIWDQHSLSEEYQIINKYSDNDTEYTDFRDTFLVYNPKMRTYLIAATEEIYKFTMERENYEIEQARILAQPLRSDMKLAGSSIPIGEEAETWFKHNPVVACNSNLGNYLVAYLEYSTNNYENHIAYQVVPEISEIPSIVEFNSSDYSVDEHEGYVEITVTRTDNIDTVVSVVYGTNDGTAISDEDYTEVNGIIMFEPGDEEMKFIVPIIDDEEYEGDETLQLTLTDIEGGTLGELDTATLTIIDNDEPQQEESTVQFNSSSYIVDENDGSIEITVTLTLPQIPTLTRVDEEETVISVVYSTSNDTAKSGEDYDSVSGTLIFEEGKTQKSFIVPIIDDRIYEGSETIKLTLSSPIGAVLGSPKTASLTIKDNESPPSNNGATYTKPETPPPTTKLPDGALIERMEGNVPLCSPVKITTVKKEIELSYDTKLFEKNPQYNPRAYYWNKDKKKWVALTTYSAGKGKVTAVNDGKYTGWFVVFGVIEPEFNDIANHWAEKVINRMNGLGMIEGYKIVDDDSVRVAKPESNVTWAEFTMFIARILNIDIDNHILPDISEKKARNKLESRFDDYDRIPEWVFNTAAAVADADIIPENRESFESSVPITRIEAAVMISRALKLIDKQKTADLENFKDYQDIPEWAIDEVAENVVTGYPDGTLKPNDNITRAEALTMLYRLFVSGLGW